METKHKPQLSSSLEGYLNPQSDDCEAQMMETTEKDTTDSQSLNSDSSLSILSPSNSLQGYNQESLGVDNGAFEEDKESQDPESCSGSLIKDEKVSKTSS